MIPILMTLHLDRPWVDDALCSQTDPDAFFPTTGSTNRNAKLICNHCPVRQDCLEYALTATDGYGHMMPGIWGGYSYNERLQIRRQIKHDRNDNQ